MDTRTIQKQINTFIDNTVKRMNVERIILYGSALSDMTKAHDIDMVVIGDFPTDDPESFLYDEYTHIPRTIDFHVYGIPSRSRDIPPFLATAIREGKVIYSS